MNLNRVFSVSLLLEEGESGVTDAALSLPALVGSKGAARVLTPKLTPQEVGVLQESARRIAAAVRGEPATARGGAR